MFTRHETWNQIHGPWSVQGIQGNQVFKASRACITQHTLHATAFELEDRFCFSFLEQTVGCRIVQRDIVKGKIFLALVARLNELACDFQNREGC